MICKLFRAKKDFQLNPEPETTGLVLRICTLASSNHFSLHFWATLVGGGAEIPLQVQVHIKEGVGVEKKGTHAFRQKLGECNHSVRIL